MNRLFSIIWFFVSGSVCVMALLLLLQRPFFAGKLGYSINTFLQYPECFISLIYSTLVSYRFAFSANPEPMTSEEQTGVIASVLLVFVLTCFSYCYYAGGKIAHRQAEQQYKKMYGTPEERAIEAAR